MAEVYRIFQRADGEAASVRAVVLALVIAAVLATTIGVIRVARQHEVLGLEEHARSGRAELVLDAIVPDPVARGELHG